MRSEMVAWALSLSENRPLQVVTRTKVAHLYLFSQALGTHSSGITGTRKQQSIQESNPVPMRHVPRKRTSKPGSVAADMLESLSGSGARGRRNGWQARYASRFIGIWRD